MAAYRLPRRCDAVINLINSFRHLPTEAAAHAHLQCAARALRSGGLFILALHLTPRGQPEADEERWSARRGNVGVNTRLWTTRRDLRRRREWCSMTLDVYTPTRAFRIRDELVFRTYTRRQFASLLRRTPALEVVETFDFSYDVKLPVKLNDATEDVVFVLRKR
jgi:SAM-dependent methyltransferase